MIEIIDKKRKPYQKISKTLNSSQIKGSEPWLTKIQTERLKTTAEVALAVIYAMGVVGIAFVAPNVLGVLDKMVFRKKKYSREEKIKKTSQTFYYLKRHGYIKFSDEGKNDKLFITESGKKHLSITYLKSLNVATQKKWDGKWWLVAADIPTKEYRLAADSFRVKLKNMGFINLQKSLWFYPFDPRSEIEFISNHYGISQYVTAMEINRMDIDDEQVLKEHFRGMNLI